MVCQWLPGVWGLLQRGLQTQVNFYESLDYFIMFVAVVIPWLLINRSGWTSLSWTVYHSHTVVFSSTSYKSSMDAYGSFINWAQKMWHSWVSCYSDRKSFQRVLRCSFSLLIACEREKKYFHVIQRLWKLSYVKRLTFNFIGTLITESTLEIYFSCWESDIYIPQRSSLHWRHSVMQDNNPSRQMWGHNNDKYSCQKSIKEVIAWGISGTSCLMIKGMIT